MNRKIVVIGAGKVGATIAYTLSVGFFASEIVMIDINKEKAAGAVMDIAQGTSFRDPISVIAGDYEDARDANIVIITSGVGRKPGQSRTDLAQVNTDILKDITPKIVSVAPDALYIVVSNPVDVLTYVFAKISGLPDRQIIGTGTILDTARLQYRLSQHFHITQQNIHAYVYGEHGDSSFIPWSCADISGASIADYEKQMMRKNIVSEPLDYEEIYKYVQTSGAEIIKRNGATFYAISAAVNKICASLVAAYDSAITVSSMFHGEYGIEDVCLSAITMIGPEGVQGKIEVPLTQEEISKLQKSAAKIKSVINSLDI